jgi:hypothetical protein
MTGRKSPEGTTEQASLSKPTEASKHTNFFDVARGITTSHEQGENSLDLVKQMTQRPQEVKRNIMFGRDLIRTEESATKARDETKPIDLKDLEQVIVQASYNRDGANLLARHYIQINRWLLHNQSRNVTQEYQINMQIWQKIDGAIRERTTAVLRDMEPNLEAASRAYLQGQQQELNGWLAQNQSYRETAIYQLNTEITKLIEGKIHIKNVKEQLAQTPYNEAHHQHLIGQRNELEQWFEGNKDKKGTSLYQINVAMAKKLDEDLQRQEKAAREMEKSQGSK